MELTSIKNFEFKPSNIVKKEVPPSYIKMAMSNELVKSISDNADIDVNKFTTEIKLGSRLASIFVWKFKLSDWKGSSLGKSSSPKLDPELMNLINSNPNVKTNGQLLSLLQKEYGIGEGIELFSSVTGSNVGNAIMHPEKSFTLPNDEHAVAFSIRFYENGKYASKVNSKANSTYIVLYNQSEESKALTYAADMGRDFANYISKDAADFINNNEGNSSIIDAIKNGLDTAGLSYTLHNNGKYGYIIWIKYKSKNIKLVYNGKVLTLSSSHDITMADKVSDRKWQEITYRQNISSIDDVNSIDFAKIVDDLYNRRNSGKLLQEYPA